MSNFESALTKWLRKNGIDCGIEISDKFAYNMEKNTFLIPVERNKEVGLLCEQFFYEYGADYVGYGFFVLGLLHEIGHYFTVSCFDEIDLLLCKMNKEFFLGGESIYERAFNYWEVPDEFSANVWAINFINYHTAAVDELAEIMKEIVNVD